ncbi:hypothetical protein C4D60_Mb08t16230 [Musa balbisiana]|uniref:Uncharacterized protein n=1 Tax=Musa balbisiana TaxID=52838 RepID=A0A4S8K472_MUSBA|nr:hypothetical protein C4D60_Mb08t16230 [Musa balbisiana]
MLSKDLIQYLIKQGASLTTMTKAWQTPIDLVSTEEVCALLVECKQPMTKDDKSTTIKEVGDSVSTGDIEENNGGSIPEESANVDKEGTDTKEKRRREDAADEDSSKPKKSLKVSLVHLTAENDVLDEDEEKDTDTKVNNHIRAGGPSNCKFGRYGSMVSSSQFV